MVKEIRSLTGIRGVAAFYVMIFHFVIATPKAKSTFLYNHFILNGFLAVDLFFILSALVMSIAYDKVFNENVSLLNYKNYMMKRIIRIYPAYFFWLILFIFYLKEFNIWAIVANVFLVQNFFGPDFIIRGVLWSLSSEFIIYLLFPFIFWGITKLKIGLQFFLLLLMFVWREEITHIPTFFIDSYGINSTALPKDAITLGTNSIFRCLSCYITGIIGYNIVKKYNAFFIKENVIKKIGSINYIFLFLFVIVTSLDIRSLSILFMWLTIVCLYILKDKFSILYTNSKIYYLGLISYSLYLSHLWINTFVNILNKRTFNDVSYYPIFVISIILTIVISGFSYKFLEKRAKDKLSRILK